MNKVIMIGRATGKPTLRTTQSGKSVATFSIAVTRRYDREQTDFFNVVAWGTLGEISTKYIEKGQQIAVSGELQIRTWRDKNEQKHYVWVDIDNIPQHVQDAFVYTEEVKFLSKAGEANPANRTAESEGDFFAGLQEDNTMTDGLMYDELPF